METTETEAMQNSNQVCQECALKEISRDYVQYPVRRDDLDQLKVVRSIIN